MHDDQPNHPTVQACLEEIYWPATERLYDKLSELDEELRKTNAELPDTNRTSIETTSAYYDWKEAFEQLGMVRKLVKD